MAQETKDKVMTTDAGWLVVDNQACVRGLCAQMKRWCST